MGGWVGGCVGWVGGLGGFGVWVGLRWGGGGWVGAGVVFVLGGPGGGGGGGTPKTPLLRPTNVVSLPPRPTGRVL